MRVWKMHAFTEVWDNKKKIDIENLKKKKIFGMFIHWSSGKIIFINFGMENVYS